MPIKFACPQCKSVLTVDDKLAGKSGKCKCGAAIKIPVPAAVATSAAAASGKKVAAGARPAAAAPAASSLGNVFNDLTEADYNRQSPFQNVYAPPKNNSTEAATLKRFDDGSAAEEAKPGQLNGMMIFIAVLNLILAIGVMTLAGLMVAAPETASQAAQAVPLLSAGLGVGIGVLSLLAVLFLAGGIGMLAKQKWGWFLAAVNFAFMPLDRLITLVMTVVGGDYTNGELMGGFFGTLIILALATVVFGDEAKRIYRVKTAVLPGIAAALGISLALGVHGALFALRVFSATPSP